MLDMVKPKFTKKSKKNGYAIMKRVAMDLERWRELGAFRPALG